jgi:hypothetical protein
MKVPKLKKGHFYIYVSPDTYYECPIDIETDEFELKYNIELIDYKRYDKIIHSCGQVDYYCGNNKITKKEYDEHWKPYLTRKALIKAIKELK